jgi:hypothetical protein
VGELGGGVGGQSELLGSVGTLLNVVGEGFLIGEEENGLNKWTMRSSDEIRLKSGRYEVIDEESTAGREKWRELSPNSLIVRIWRPQKRIRHLAD